MSAFLVCFCSLGKGLVDGAVRVGTFLWGMGKKSGVLVHTWWKGDSTYLYNLCFPWRSLWPLEALLTTVHPSWSQGRVFHSVNAYWVISVLHKLGMQRWTGLLRKGFWPPAGRPRAPRRQQHGSSLHTRCFSIVCISLGCNTFPFSSPLILALFCVCVCVCGHAHGMWKLPDQRLNLCRSSNPCCCSDNSRAWTHWATRELQGPLYEQEKAAFHSGSCV